MTDTKTKPAAKPAEAAKPAATKSAETTPPAQVEGASLSTASVKGAYDHLIGELTPGQSGWLPLDDQGVPSGPATLERPAQPQAACRVFAADPTSGGDALVTNSGASISGKMTPQTDAIPDTYVPPSPPPPPVA